MHADEIGRLRPAVRIELAACLERDHDAIMRAVRVEVGDDASGDPAAVAVRVECAGEGPDAGVVLEVSPPGSVRRYRYALDWRAQPLDARPRLLGLAVAEAVDASRIELTAVPEPAAPYASLAPAPSRTTSRWTVAIAGFRRSFHARSGVESLGMGVMPSRRLSSRLQLTGDVLIEGATVLTTSGAVIVRSVSSAPRIAYRTTGRLRGEIGVGARLGVVRLEGEPLPRSQLAGASLVRVWLGPTATLAIAFDVTPAVGITAGLEVGVIASGATARDLGEPVAAIDGTWTSFGLAASIAL